MPLQKCPTCGFYTLQGTCPRDGAATIKPGPAKYSPEDPYGKYRRLAKQQAKARAAASDAGKRA
jgi:H/ACA ribonucleoprotein complex subunit 3